MYICERFKITKMDNVKKEIILLVLASVIFVLLLAYILADNLMLTNNIAMKKIASEMPYEFDNPAVIYPLPDKLDEISGISFYRDDVLACIQDEDGIVFFYDTNKKEVINQVKFGQDADYEDIEVVHNTVYVLESNGDIFRFQLPEYDDNPDTKKIKTGLSSKNDVEGMCYDAVTNSLLLACKESPELNGEMQLNDIRAVYRFDIEKQKIEKNPFLTITDKVLDENFKPSGIAVNPLTQEIFILAHVGKKIVIMSRNNQIVEVIPLERRIFKQPEGICFNKSGDLFISNEARSGGANVLRFNYIHQ